MKPTDDTQGRPSPGEESTQADGHGTGPGADAPTDGPNRPRGLGVLGWLRWFWRTLTSMRTALILLFLFALASVPGSLFPQRGVEPSDVVKYFAAHPDSAPWLDKFWLFDVFSAPWFAAIYLLLFVSLVGCVVPRLSVYFRELGRRPPAAPRNLTRLPHSATFEAGDGATVDSLA